MIGKTQPQMAALLGVAEVTVRKIENGALELSQRLAQRLMIVTGVDPDSLRGSGPIMSLLPNLEYSKEVFEKYRAQRATTQPGESAFVLEGGKYQPVDEQIRDDLEMMESVLKLCAFGAIQTNKFPLFKYLFGSWITDVKESLSLEGGIVAMAKSVGVGSCATEKEAPRRRGRTASGKKVKAG